MGGDDGSRGVVAVVVVVVSSTREFWWFAVTLAGHGQNDVGGWLGGWALLLRSGRMRERRLCLASCNLAGLTGRHHPQPYHSWPSCCSPSPSSLSSPSSSSSSFSYQPPTGSSSRPTLSPLARSIVTSPQLFPHTHALKPSVLTGFFFAPR